MAFIRLPDISLLQPIFPTVLKRGVPNAQRLRQFWTASPGRSTRSDGLLILPNPANSQTSPISAQSTPPPLFRLRWRGIKFLMGPRTRGDLQECMLWTTFRRQFNEQTANGSVCAPTFARRPCGLELHEQSTPEQHPRIGQASARRGGTFDRSSTWGHARRQGPQVLAREKHNLGKAEFC
jgi:hypothetical protein